VNLIDLQVNGRLGMTFQMRMLELLLSMEEMLPATSDPSGDKTI
jgi:hypothetical protein